MLGPLALQRNMEHARAPGAKRSVGATWGEPRLEVAAEADFEIWAAFDFLILEFDERTVVQMMLKILIQMEMHRFDDAKEAKLMQGLPRPPVDAVTQTAVRVPCSATDARIRNGSKNGSGACHLGVRTQVR